MPRKALILVVATALGLASTAAIARVARDYIFIVGSSTVYPFVTVVAENFGRSTNFKTPKVESTGSGGGLKLFCAGVGVEHPDMTNASRRIKQSEVELCASNGVREIVEVKIGYDGIVLARDKSAVSFPLSRRQIFLALAQRVPDPARPAAAGPGTLVANPYMRWSDINPSLPETRIEVLGPPPTSGTRDAFVELAMEGGCDTFDWIRRLGDTDESAHRELCHSVREDGGYVEAGENDNLIVQKLQANPRAMGIFGFSFLDQNGDKIKGLPVDGYSPTFERIANGDYPIARPLYFYVKSAHARAIPGVREYLAEFTSERTWGEDGYLTDRGLIPMPPAERQETAKAVSSMTPLSLAAE